MCVIKSRCRSVIIVFQAKRSVEPGSASGQPESERASVSAKMVKMLIANYVIYFNVPPPATAGTFHSNSIPCIANCSLASFK